MFVLFSYDATLFIVLCYIAQSCLTLCNPMDSSPPGSSVHGILRARTLEWFSHALLQEIFPTQGSNPGLPHCRQILYHLSHQGSPRYSFFLYNFNNFCWTPNIHQELKHINALCMLPHLILSGRFYDFHFKMRSVKLIGD